MILSLEVLQAKHGDCLILHYGNNKAPEIMVIDGGPSGVYDASLKPRLAELKDLRSPNATMDISMIMISHLDDDHINGILRFASDVEDKKEYDVKNLWANTFDDIIGNVEISSVITTPAGASAASVGSLPINTKTPKHLAAVIASTGQGRQLRDIAKKLGWLKNAQFTALKGNKLVRGDKGKKVITLNGLKITVLHPNKERLVKLQKQWDDDLKAAKNKKDKAKIIGASLTSLDNSPFNISSIVCLIELKGKRILLTGDGRSDDIYNGLKENKLLDSKGNFHVNILKMPHHGSIRNMDKDFLGKITADHYIISADGNYDNPDEPLLELMMGSIKKGTIYFTNRTGTSGVTKAIGLKKKLDTFLKKLTKSGSKIKTVFKSKEPMIINLIDKV